MAHLSDKVRGLWKKGLSKVEKASSSLYHNTKFKVSELNLLEHQRELMSSVASRCYELFQKGETFPEEVQALLQDLADTDEALNTLRMEHLALIEAGKQTEAAAQDAEAAVPAEAEPAEAEAEAQASDPDEDEPDGPAPIDLLTGAPAEDLRPVEEVTDSVAEDPEEPKPEQ